jgi:hypothetical protein
MASEDFVESLTFTLFKSGFCSDLKKIKFKGLSAAVFKIFRSFCLQPFKIYSTVTDSVLNFLATFPTAITNLSAVGSATRRYTRPEEVKTSAVQTIQCAAQAPIHQRHFQVQFRSLQCRKVQ